MTKIHEGKIRIGGDTSQGVAAVKRVTGSLKKMAPSMQQVKIAAALMAAAVVGTTAAIVKMTTATAKAGDMFHKMSLRTGMSAQVLSELKHAAEISGASIDDVEKGVKTLAKRISDARFGLQTYVRIFENLGVAYQTSSGELREVDDVMMDAIEGINKLSTDTEKAAMAQELFGKAGTKLLPLFKEGKEGIAALRAEARELGITFSDQAAKQSADLVDAMTRLKGSFTGLRNEIGIEVMPTMTTLFDTLTGWMKDSGPEFAAFGKKFSLAVADAVALSIEYVGKLPQAVYEVEAAFHRAVTGAKAMAVGIVDAAAVANLLDPRVLAKFAYSMGEQGDFGKALAYANPQLAILKENLMKSGGASAQAALDADAAAARMQGFADKAQEAADRIRLSMSSPGDGGDKDEGQPTGLDKVLGLTPEQVEQTMIKAQEALQMTMEQLRAQYDQIFLDEGERLDLWYSEMYAKVGEHEEAKFMLYQIYMEKKRLLGDKLKAAEMKNADNAMKWELISMKRKLSVVAGGFNNMASIAQSFYELSGKQNKAAFVAFKVFSIAETVINTYKAAQGAYAAMSSIPFVGPALGIAAAAEAIMAGAARVSSIASMEPGGSASVSSAGGGGGGGGYSGGGGSGGGYTPSFLADRNVTASEEPETQRQGVVINVHVSGNLIDHKRFARELGESIAVAKGDGVDFD